MASDNSGPTVTIKQGELLGTTGINLNGETFFKFLGVPYAKPPIGPLRFKAPEPPEPWKGIRDCTKDGSSNFAVSFRTGKTVGSEDCLYLNVHTRSLPKPGEPLKPVLFYIHGGAFTLGNGTQEMCAAEYLLIQDVVLVTINYRLGVFGFLSLKNSSLEVPGNAGLKDQTQALRWVQANIQQFNGDPNNVTIFGVSAGGASVHLQVLSPCAKGLFHKAIAQSGAALNPWVWGQRNSIQLAEKLGKTVSTEAEALEVLMKASAEQLFQVSLVMGDRPLKMDERRVFGPIIEKPNPKAFLTENPADILASGRFNQVPLIHGFCSNEGLILGYGAMLGVPYDFKPENNLVPWTLNHKNPNFSKWEDTIRTLYYKQGVSKRGIYQQIGDIGFHVGVIDSIKLALKNANNPIYLYQLSYETENIKNLRKMLKIEDDISGVPHGGDQNFLFSSSFGEIPGQLTEEHLAAVKTVTGIWAEFARTGIPHTKWPPIINSEEIVYINLAEKMTVEKNPFKERITVWEEIIKDAGGYHLTIEESA